VSMKEYTKWACVCKIWRKEHSIFYTNCLNEAIQFKTVCFKEIVANSDMSSLMRGMKQFIWNYNVQVVSIALMTRLISNDNNSDIVEIIRNQGMFLIDGVVGYVILENETENSDAIRAYCVSDGSRIIVTRQNLAFDPHFYLFHQQPFSTPAWQTFHNLTQAAAQGSTQQVIPLTDEPEAQEYASSESDVDDSLRSETQNLNDNAVTQEQADK